MVLIGTTEDIIIQRDIHMTEAHIHPMNHRIVIIRILQFLQITMIHIVHTHPVCDSQVTVLDGALVGELIVENKILDKYK
jgi:hypothetical protein